MMLIFQYSIWKINLAVSDIIYNGCFDTPRSPKLILHLELPCYFMNITVLLAYS